MADEDELTHDTDEGAQEAAASADAPEDNAPEWTEDEIAEARFFNWKSPEEWAGEKPPGYIADPREYLARVQRSGIFKAMQSKVDKAEASAEEQARKLEQVARRTIEHQKQEHERKLAEITQQQRRAVEEADTDTWDRLEREKSSLSPPDEGRDEPDKPKVDPVITAYRDSDEGAWLRNGYLADAAAKIVGANPEVMQKSTQDQLAYAEAEIRRLYPAYFPKPEPAPQPKTRATVDGGGLAGGGKMNGGGAFAKLPADARSQFKALVEMGTTFKDTKEDRERYAEYYNEA